MAMASAGPYASLHLAPDRQPRQHATTQFFTGRVPFLPPKQQRQKHWRHQVHLYNGRKTGGCVGWYILLLCVCFFISFVACVCVLIGLSLVYVLILSFVLGQLSVLCSLPVQLSMNRYCLWSLWMYRFEQNKMKWYEMKLLYNCIF